MRTDARELFLAAAIGAATTGMTGWAVLNAVRPPERPTDPERFRATLVEIRGNELQRELIEVRRLNAELRLELDAMRRAGGDVRMPGGVEVREEDRIPPAGVPVPGK